MSELNLTLTAKPSTVLTGVNWTQNATILHRRAAAATAAAVAAIQPSMCEMHHGAMIFVVWKLDRRWRRLSVQYTSTSDETSRDAWGNV